MRIVRNLIVVIIAVSIVGVGVNVFAHGGRGWGGCGQNGPGWERQGGQGTGYGKGAYTGDTEQLQQKRDAFFAETQDLRTALLEKEREMQNVLAESEPDAAKASLIQKEISELQSQFDQKRLDHMIEMRELNPNAGRGYMSGGPMRGYGYSGKGNCRR